MADGLVPHNFVSIKSGLDQNNWKALTAGHPTNPINLEWKITDAPTGRTFSGKYATSMGQAMAANGITPLNITRKIGFSHPYSTAVPFITFEPKIDIPKDLLRPKLSVDLDSFYFDSWSSDAAFNVHCVLEKEDEILPRVLEIGAVPESAAPSTPKDNGARMLTNKMFPNNTDSTLTSMSGQFKLPDSFKAQIELDLHSGTFYPEDIEKIKVIMKYGADEVGNHIYVLQPEDYMNVKPNSSKFSVRLTIDAEDFANLVTYVPNEEKRISFEFVPMGSLFNEENTGKKSLTGIIPLFNAKDHASSLCLNGVYNPNFTVMYGASELLDTMNALANPTQGDPVKFRCNDMSLPWGGQFKIGSIKHSGHQHGKHADVRYFNSTSTLQDNYDLGNAQNRRTDVSTYMALANWASKVVNESSYAGVKVQILQACQNGTFYHPCNGTTTLASLTKEMVLQLCQWHNIVDTQCSSEALGFKDAIARYSIWAEQNMNTLTKIRGSFGEIRMSGGEALRPINVPISLDASGLNWQEAAINRGVWPDQTTIFKVSASSISSTPINSCIAENCGLASSFKRDDGYHFNHIHLGK